ncbi:MAG: type II toxin-antitoxin system prevent-host-death family antitoxin [Candidatus Eremiobacteraeota bacterium]|nr:type II toxin-antitoxin system prevent-host-death family antitoxin [Candidatus Eremiobacteraeota bacterium]
MKYATVRDFRVNASKVMKEAEDEEIVVTRRGKPFALLVPVSDENIEKVQKAIKAAKLYNALEDLWEEAKERGTDRLAAEEIDAEIKAYRKEKRAKSSH